MWNRIDLKRAVQIVFYGTFFSHIYVYEPVCTVSWYEMFLTGVQKKKGKKLF